MKYVTRLLGLAIFFTLCAFSLNNDEAVTVHFFFGTFWRAPLVLVVLTAFAIGIVVGVLGMVPRWWKHRSAARRALHAVPPAAPSVVPDAGTPVPIEQIPHGL